MLLHILSAFALVAGRWAQFARLANSPCQERTQVPLSSLLARKWMVREQARHPWLQCRLGLWAVGSMGAWLAVIGSATGDQRIGFFASLLLYLILIPMIIFVFLPCGKDLWSETSRRGSAQGLITREVREQWKIRSVRVAHIVEALVILFIIYLMVMKPF